MRSTQATAGFFRAVNRSLPGIVVVAATYIYFLLYAQYGFLRLLEDRRVSIGDVQRFMGAMGLTGLLVSLGVAWLLSRVRPVLLVRSGLALGGLSAMAALACHDTWALTTIAALIGASTALTTVALAARLRTFITGAGIGIHVGVGTGAAYLICNIPALFEGPPAIQSAAAALACLAGVVATFALDAPSHPAGQPQTIPSQRSLRALRTHDYTALGFAGVMLSFLALIWLDSAAFAVIQETENLKAATWGDSGKWVIGITHLLAAILAGRLIDRGGFHGLLLSAFALFAVAFRLLAGDEGNLFVGPLYATGISFYSVALVVFPAYRGNASGLVPRRWRAAILYGVAGWIGSALGVGLAQELRDIPPTLLWIAGALLLIAQVLRGLRRLYRRHRLPGALLIRLGKAHALTLLFCLAAALVYSPLAADRSEPKVANATPSERGRRVYVQEGCINCHSQYVRPIRRDLEPWGPQPTAPGVEEPPLYGNRRQGPDLTNAGNRRSAVWHRLHLEDPRAFAPGSRMPSYAHLFSEGSRRGEDLVAFLASLGADSSAERFAFIQQVSMGGTFRDGSKAHGKLLFDRHCAVCHGREGNGNGPLAPRLYRPAMDLTKGNFWGVSWGPDSEPLNLALARVVKFGLPGTSMPGHELLTDDELADLVAWVLELSRSGEAGRQTAEANPPWETWHGGAG